MMRNNTEAIFDCLYIVSRLQKLNSYISIQEVHLFAYLACLLWLYQKKPLSDWGYTFVGTELGAPFSKDISMSLDELIEFGYLQKRHGYINLNESAIKSLDVLSKLNINLERSESLKAACASTAAFSVGMVSSALEMEPDLKRSKAYPVRRSLLEITSQSQLYNQFESLRSALNTRSEDLRLPAVIWLSALYQLNYETNFS